MGDHRGLTAVVLFFVLTLSQDLLTLPLHVVMVKLLQTPKRYVNQVLQVELLVKLVAHLKEQHQIWPICQIFDSQDP